MALFSKDTKKAKVSKDAKPHHAWVAVLPNGAAHEALRAPWFSEKALIGTEKGVYVFAVSPRATSAEVAGAVKEIYGVAPKAVRLAHTPGKRKALKTRRGTGRRAARHKAYVTLNAGDTIALA